MKQLKRAKKGAVLILTAMILFVVTTTLALFTTTVLYNRNQKVQFESRTKTKVALKNASFDVFNIVIDEYKALLPETEGGVISIHTKDNVRTKDYMDQDIALYFNKKESTETEKLYFFEIHKADFIEDLEEIYYDYGIYTLISITGEITNKDSYKIKEMRYL